MSTNVIELRNGTLKRVIFYEVSDAQKLAIWGGESPSEALKWYRNSPIDSKIWVSEWLTDDENAKEVSTQIEITPIVLSTIADCMERWS
ncbi:MAG: hypothetical protein EBS86_16440 [Crocinitomicaceae bacterium]|nr:hypothetical protein [Crocinitomicaceae bacterium]